MSEAPNGDAKAKTMFEGEFVVTQCKLGFRLNHDFINFFKGVKDTFHCSTVGCFFFLTPLKQQP